MKKRGRNNNNMVAIKCTICRLPMDCPESLLLADQHFCPKCSRLKEFFHHGATQALGFLITAEMPPWHLDDLEKQIRTAKES